MAENKNTVNYVPINRDMLKLQPRHLLFTRLHNEKSLKANFPFRPFKLYWDHSLLVPSLFIIRLVVSPRSCPLDVDKTFTYQRHKQQVSI